MGIFIPVDLETPVGAKRRIDGYVRILGVARIAPPPAYIGNNSPVGTEKIICQTGSLLFPGDIPAI